MGLPLQEAKKKADEADAVRAREQRAREKVKTRSILRRKPAAGCASTLGFHAWVKHLVNRRLLCLFSAVRIGMQHAS